ncbi:MAG: SpoIIE family protein phosphatase, partial [Verrucomicrobiota bacterium]
KQIPDLILLDLMMPEMDGLETCSRIQSDSRFNKIPIIFLTASNEMDHLVDAFKRGAVDYVTKPFQAAELLARVRTHLNLKHATHALANSNAQLNQQLEEAAKYVSATLPKPQEIPVQAQWLFHPSQHLGGDIFGYQFLDEKTFICFLVDVCGHGVGASLLAISISNMIRGGRLGTDVYRQPEETLNELNRAFPMFENNRMFFTLWYGVYDLDAKTLTYASGGHPPALLLKKSGELRELTSHGLVAGMDPEYRYRSESTAIETGDQLYLFSDGIYEIKYPDGEYMGMDSFSDFLKTKASSDASDLSAWRSFVEKEGQTTDLEDDFSLLKLRF